MTGTILDLTGPRTPLYPLIRARMLQLERPVSDRLQAWMMFHANGGLNITDFHGKNISYRGITFQGSPEQVFWSGHLEPFMVDAAMKLFDWVQDHCRSNNLDANKYMAEARDLVRVFVIKTYTEMVDVDRRLQGRGFHNSVEPKDATHKIVGMHRHIDDLLLALTHKGKDHPIAGEQRHSSIFKLEPNIYGIGFNLTALWSWLRRKIDF